MAVRPLPWQKHPWIEPHPPAPRNTTQVHKVPAHNRRIEDNPGAFVPSGRVR